MRHVNNGKANVDQFYKAKEGLFFCVQILALWRILDEYHCIESILQDSKLNPKPIEELSMLQTN
jgi:hypothetical protein